MKSLCVKNNNSDIISFIDDKLTNLGLDSVFVSTNQFRVYKNIIVHYAGDDTNKFYDELASVLADCVTQFFERKLIRRVINYNYFYFSSLEKKEIVDVAEDILQDDVSTRDENYFSVYYAILDYIKENKSIVLDGFVNFRLSNYMKNLDYIVDMSVNKYITDKEYLEFVNMLKLYVSLTPPKAKLVHLVYIGGESVLLDSDKSIIPLEDEDLSQKYLSDFSFSANDFALNALLNLTPRKLVIHLIGNSSDEFINTIKLIFEGRYEVCGSCELCRLYKIKF